MTIFFVRLLAVFLLVSHSYCAKSKGGKFLKANVDANKEPPTGFFIKNAARKAHHRIMKAIAHARKAAQSIQKKEEKFPVPPGFVDPNQKKTKGKPEEKPHGHPKEQPIVAAKKLKAKSAINPVVVLSKKKKIKPAAKHVKSKFAKFKAKQAETKPLQNTNLQREWSHLFIDLLIVICCVIGCCVVIRCIYDNRPNGMPYGYPSPFGFPSPMGFGPPPGYGPVGSHNAPFQAYPPQTYGAQYPIPNHYWSSGVHPGLIPAPGSTPSNLVPGMKTGATPGGPSDQSPSIVPPQQYAAKLNPLRGGDMNPEPLRPHPLYSAEALAGIQAPESGKRVFSHEHYGAQV